MVEKDWAEIKRSIRNIRSVCHGMKPIKNGMGIRCFSTTDEFQDKMRKLFQDKYRRHR